MDLLLDTHAWLWLSLADPQLSQTALDAIGDPANRIFLSVASAWEISIKYALGRLNLSGPPEIIIPQLLSTQTIAIVDVKIAHVVGVASLPHIHKDPFDRLLISQAVYETFTIITRDPFFASYGVATLW